MDLLIWSALFIVLSIYYSGMETAYTSFDRIVVRGWVKARGFGSRSANFLSEKPARFLMTTLIGTNISNVAYATLIVIWAESIQLAPVWVMIGSPLLVLVFAEIMPKMFAYAFANPLVRIASHPLRFSYLLFAPIRWLLTPFMKMTSRNYPVGNTMSSMQSVMRRELDLILAEAETEGVASKSEADLLARYLNTRDIRVREIMTPRTETIAIDFMASIEDALQLFMEYRLSLLPVYQEDLDHIIGCISVRDLLEKQSSIEDILRPILMIPETKRAVDLLEQFKTEKYRIAVVIDEYGGMDGVISLMDVVSALVGPISEAWDTNRHIIKRVAPGRYLATGAASRDEIEKATGWQLPPGEFKTLSGWLSAELGHIPRAGEQFEYEEAKVRVLRSSPRQVEVCLLSFHPDAK